MCSISGYNIALPQASGKCYQLTNCLKQAQVGNLGPEVLLNINYLNSVLCSRFIMKHNPVCLDNLCPTSSMSSIKWRKIVGKKL